MLKNSLRGQIIGCAEEVREKFRDLGPTTQVKVEMVNNRTHSNPFNELKERSKKSVHFTPIIINGVSVQYP